MGAKIVYLKWLWNIKHKVSVLFSEQTSKKTELYKLFSFCLAGLFTLILAAVFPSNSGDRFTLSKLLAVFLR